MRKIILVGLLFVSFNSFGKSFPDKNKTSLPQTSCDCRTNQNDLFLKSEEKKSDSTRIRRHSIYIEPMLFGRTGSIGYSYDFLFRDKIRANVAIGFGAVFKFYNPQTAFLFPLGLDFRFKLRKRFFISTGLYNFYYLNYWGNFTEEGIDCSGLWLCPPKQDPIILTTYLGGSWEFRKVIISPRVYLGFDDFFPFPALMIKYKL